MKKNAFLRSFCSKTNSDSYIEELFPFLVFLIVYIVICVVIYFTDEPSNRYTGIILAAIFIAFLWQSVTLCFRLYEVRINRIDSRVLRGEYNNKYTYSYIRYDEFKKISKKMFGSIKLYCCDCDNKYHIIYIHVLLHKNDEIERRYYLDRQGYDYGKFLMKLNEQKIIISDQLKIVGSNLNVDNDKLMDMLRKKYIKTK